MYIYIYIYTPDQAETQMHSLERTVASWGLYVNAHKTEYMSYNQTGDISTLDGTPLKLVDKFTFKLDEPDMQDTAGEAGTSS